MPQEVSGITVKPIRHTTVDYFDTEIALSFICRRLSDIESLGSRPFEGFLA